MVPPEEITKKVNEVIAKYVDTSAINLNKLIDGSIVNRANVSNAIAIQDLVRRLNGSCLKVAYICFSSSIQMMADILKFIETPLMDERIEEYEYHEYDPIMAPILITVVISELVSNRKTCSHILARAT